MAKRPRWISKNEDGKDSILRSEPDIAVQAARFGNIYPHRPTKGLDGHELDPDQDPRAHLYQLTIAQFFAEARTLEDWRSYSESYPSEAISQDQIIQQTNPNVAVRAYYLANALPKLIELLKLPPAMADDLRTMLNPLLPIGAERRANIQKAILDDPLAFLQQIAERTNSDAGQISKDGKAGLIKWPSDPAR